MNGSFLYFAKFSRPKSCIDHIDLASIAMRQH